MKNKILLVVIISMSAVMPASHRNSNNNSIVPVVAVIGAVGLGYTAWRMTTPSDNDVVSDINTSLKDNGLDVYGQEFVTKVRLVNQEDTLHDNLKKLGYTIDKPEQSDIQANLVSGELKLNKMKESIWFRSFLNSQVSAKYNELENARATSERLQSYFSKHGNYFQGCNLVKEQQDFVAKSDADGDVIRYIRTTRLGRNAYPLIYVVGMWMKNISWMNNFKHDSYPELDKKLSNVCDYYRSEVVSLQSNRAYLDEKDEQRKDDEEKRKKELHELEKQKVAALNRQADAEFKKVQAAQRQADATVYNVQTERERLKLEKQHNERAHIQDRVSELKRRGYSDYDIQQTLDYEGFTRALIGLFFGV